MCFEQYRHERAQLVEGLVARVAHGVEHTVEVEKNGWKTKNQCEIYRRINWRGRGSDCQVSKLQTARRQTKSENNQETSPQTIGRAIESPPSRRDARKPLISTSQALLVA